MVSLRLSLVQGAAAAPGAIAEPRATAVGLWLAGMHKGPKRSTSSAGSAPAHSTLASTCMGRREKMNAHATNTSAMHRTHQSCAQAVTLGSTRTTTASTSGSTRDPATRGAEIVCQAMCECESQQLSYKNQLMCTSIYVYTFGCPCDLVGAALAPPLLAAPRPAMRLSDYCCY
jgi:hypothetical protein